MKKSTVADAPIWAVVQELVEWPIRGPVLPPEPSPRKEPFGLRNVLGGVAFGPMTLADAQEFFGTLYGTATLCIVPAAGLQAIHLDGLALHRASEALNYRLPGMVFYPNCDLRHLNTSGILLIGYGEPIPDIFTADISASSSPNTAFPVGDSGAKPIRHKRGETLRDNAKWMPPDITTLENLAPLAAFLADLNLTDKDRADFRIAEVLRKAQDQKDIQEVDAYWKARREADALAPHTSRKFLP